ncbi:ABC transporter substrate-binding protein [Actinomadura alba]|uniref:ABC transporter substrate-binding protein n=1 Tax=Actinomadura alba TaxID=406431 RepID=A0ABR7LYG6_9ACTN|nr:ABC transporter substrate-binding protein [Actinomadura alba]MBC6469728.1 ABC transporter substrate-binding protein [Actinomadura alba]
MTNHTTRRLITLIAALVLTTVTAACGGGDDSEGASAADGPADLAKVTLRVGDQKGSSIQSLLTAAGELDGTPYKISWSLFTSGPPILEGINAGAVDFGSVGNTPPIFAAAANSSIVIVGGTDVRLDGQAILVPRDSAIRSPADLRGKKIAVAKGSSAHGQLLGVLKKNGLSFADIQPQYLQPADALTALTGGKVDAWAAWEPYTAQAEAQANARILVDGKGYVNGYGFQVTSRKALDDPGRTAALKDFLARFQRSVLWTNDHQKEWAAIWAKDTGLPVPVAEKAVERRLTTIVKLDDTLISSEQQLADSFSEAKVLPGKVKIADFIDPRFNDTVPAG